MVLLAAKVTVPVENSVQSEMDSNANM
jgi:hypothetical protein